MPLQRSLYPWYVVGVLMLAFVLSFADRYILGLLTIALQRDLGLTPTQLSLLIGPGFVIPFVLAGLPIARLADRHSRRRIIILSLLFWSLATLGCAFARDFSQLLLLRALVGVGEAALAPAAYSLIVDYFAPEQRASALSTFSVGTYAGSGLAFTLGGAIIAYTAKVPTTLAWQSWQLVFISLGLCGLLLSPLLLSLREPPRAVQHQALPLSSLRTQLWQQRRVLLHHHLGMALLSLAGSAAVAWVPAYFIHRFGWPPGRFGLAYGGIIALCGSAGLLCAGALADRAWRSGQRDAALRLAGNAALGSATLGLLYLLMPDARLSLLMMLPSTFFSAMPFGLAVAALQALMPATLRAQASALYALVTNLVGLGLGPLAVTWLAHHVYGDEQALGKALLTVIGSAQLLAAVCLHSGRKAYREAVEQRAAPT